MYPFVCRDCKLLIETDCTYILLKLYVILIVYVEATFLLVSVEDSILLIQDINRKKKWHQRWANSWRFNAWLKLFQGNVWIIEALCFYFTLYLCLHRFANLYYIICLFVEYFSMKYMWGNIIHRFWQCSTEGLESRHWLCLQII